MSPARPSANPTVDSSASFEGAMRELETLVQQMESGNLPLDEMLQSYRRGAQLVSACKFKLDEVEQQIQMLDGEVLSLFDPAAVLSQPDKSQDSAS